MPRPGVEVTNRASRPARGPSTDTGQVFAVGEVEDATGEMHLVRNLEEFTDTFGGRVDGGLRDWVETSLREGSSRIFISGVAVAASDATKIAALDLFTKDLGPGQVAIPGETTDAVHTALLDHAEDNNRFAVVDIVDDADVADLAAAVAALAGLSNASYGAAFAPVVEIPGLVPDTVREVQYSGLQTGLFARSDRKFSANVPAAGANGEAEYVVDVKRVWTDAQREDLNEAGVNIGKDVYGAIRTYGYRTLVDPDGPDAQWLSVANARLRMQITAEAERIGETFMFTQIDGRLQKVAEFAGALTGMLTRYYNQGALFGLTPEEAFVVDVGPDVNTPTTLAANELRAVLAVRMSPFAELVTIEIVKVPITEAL